MWNFTPKFWVLINPKNVIFSVRRIFLFSGTGKKQKIGEFRLFIVLFPRRLPFLLLSRKKSVIFPFLFRQGMGRKLNTGWRPKNLSFCLKSAHKAFLSIIYTKFYKIRALTLTQFNSMPTWPLYQLIITVRS